MRAHMRRDLFISSANGWAHSTAPRTAASSGSEMSRKRAPVLPRTYEADWRVGPSGFIGHPARCARRSSPGERPGGSCPQFVLHEAAQAADRLERAALDFVV